MTANVNLSQLNVTLINTAKPSVSVEKLNGIKRFALSLKFSAFIVGNIFKGPILSSTSRVSVMALIIARSAA